MIKTIGFDTETYYDDEVSVKPLGAWKYARHPRAVCYMISIHDGTNTWAGEPKDFNFESLRGNTLVSHNAAFDQEVYFANVEKGLWPKLDIPEWHCTANLSSYLCNRRSLADASEFLLDRPMSKVMRNYMKGKTWADAQADGDNAEKLLEYARGDACNCYDIWDRFNTRWPEWERRLSQMTICQGRKGVRIHQDRLDAGIILMQRVLLGAIDKLPWMNRGDKKAKPASRPRIVEECRRNDIPPPPIKSNDPEDYEEWEIEYAPRFPWVKALADIRKANKALATLQTMKLRLREDGTIAFSLKYFGAHTGRWAGDGGINFQNFAREPIFVDAQWCIIDDPKELAGMFRENPDTVPVQSLDMRGLLLPPEGKLLGSVDAAQIEPRVLNKLVNNTDLLQRIKDGFPIYEAHARASMGWTGGKLKSEAPKLYSLAKARVLGLGYGCGWEKFIVVAKDLAGIDITEDDESVALSQSLDGQIYSVESSHNKEKGGWVFEEDKLCPPYVFIDNPRRPHYREEWTPQLQLSVHGANSKSIVKAFREDNPLITAYWREMQEALEEAARKGDDLEIELPSGRVLVYRKVRSETRVEKNRETGQPEKRLHFTAEADGRRKHYYGGKIVENITQAVARDAFAQNTLLAIDAGIEVMWTVHDEDVNAVVDEAEGEKARILMARTPEWLEGCPLDAELAISDRYKK